ncbi:hypothetical protein [Oryzifoliimicrobium ureilyticus]|uniref:hypothetical protein n=1 Tax=Oryzifoliimicrobium ureilyticus TaxID=3113724 RepID=UPI0030764A21
MPNNETIALEGVIQHVFAHRFTISTDDGSLILADLGPKGAEVFPLQQGLSISVEGERRPSEIKVTRISAEGLEPVMIEHKKPHHKSRGVHQSDLVDLEVVKEALEAKGWSIVGEVRRKPKHFEILARRSGDELSELHVDFSGEIYKQKPAKELQLDAGQRQ